MYVRKALAAQVNPLSIAEVTVKASKRNRGIRETVSSLNVVDMDGAERWGSHADLLRACGGVYIECMMI